MYRALSDNFGIARVLARLRHNEEEIPVHDEDLQALASMHERVKHKPGTLWLAFQPISKRLHEGYD